MHLRILLSKRFWSTRFAMLSSTVHFHPTQPSYSAHGFLLHALPAVLLVIPFASLDVHSGISPIACSYILHISFNQSGDVLMPPDSRHLQPRIPWNLSLYYKKAAFWASSRCYGFPLVSMMHFHHSSLVGAHLSIPFELLLSLGYLLSEWAVHFHSAWPSSCTVCILRAQRLRHLTKNTCLVARQSSKAHMRTTKLPSTLPLRTCPSSIKSNWDTPKIHAS